MLFTKLSEEPSVSTTPDNVDNILCKLLSAAAPVGNGKEIALNAVVVEVYVVLLGAVDKNEFVLALNHAE